MAQSARLIIALVHIFAWSFLDILEISNGSEDDINCLRSIKESLEDPYNHLKDSWNFSNPTEGFFCDFVGVECSSTSSETTINLSLGNMGLKGQFPREIQNCSSLTGLDLSGNELSGAIPSDISQLLPAVLKLDLSFNNFSGEIPKSIKAMQIIEDFVGLHWNLAFLLLRSLAFYFGWVVAMVSVVVFMFVKWLLVKKATTKKNEKIMKEFTNERTKNRMISQMGGMVTRMSLTELSEATGFFSTHNLIGSGKIGTMYKAVLPNCWPLAVKRLHDCQSSEKQFVSELSALAILRHDNIVPLLGYCREQNETCFWIKIATGIARGLAWLHHKYDFRVVHLNLGSNSVLLDKNFEPKISNFGEAKILSSGGLMFMNYVIDSSTSSFVDSGVWELGFIKKDVYDFGILLLELITRKEPNEINNYSDGLNGSLFDWITHLLTSSSDLYNVIDKSLTGQGFDDEIFQFLDIACNCLNPFPGQRPTMLELYNKISIFGERYGVPNDYESEILRESEIATTSTSNEIVGVSFGVTGDFEILREFEIATASSSSEIVEVESVHRSTEA
uniref:Protein kinase domain-containing protein n=1 Tax=Fagus sylvatica TaxID=28930 RepID=A0A2N9FXZ7_FAGSY